MYVFVCVYNTHSTCLIILLTVHFVGIGMKIKCPWGKQSDCQFTCVVINDVPVMSILIAAYSLL